MPGQQVVDLAEGIALPGSDGTDRRVAGTSGLVGIFDLWQYTDGVLGKIGIFVLMIVLPAVLNIVFSEIMRKLKWIRPNDMKLPE